MKGILLFLIAIALMGFAELKAQLKSKVLSTYHSGIFDDGAAEIGSFDPITNLYFFTNATDASIDVLDLSDPSNPILSFSIDITEYGDAVNSVAVKNGVVAAAIEADPKQAPGKVVFFDTDGNFLNEVTTGSLPDMVTFTNDGNKVIVANEGEPNDEYTVDPEGSVSIIDISNGVANATLQHADFRAFNGAAESLKNRGIRIFGPNASVSQDLEPEYIAVSSDDVYAYVTLQEANALAVVDIENAEVLDILPLGYKFWQFDRPVMGQFFLNQLTNLPSLGTPLYEGAEEIKVSGFSGLYCNLAESSQQELVFYTIPDRGPNAGAVSKGNVGSVQNLRPFKLPDYQARIVKFTLNITTGNVTLSENDYIYLTQKDGVTPITGRCNIPGFDEVPVAFTDDNVYTNIDYEFDGVQYHELEYDPFGGDFEGILLDNDGNFWMCDEYRPALYKFAPDGTLLERYVPEGTSLLGTIEQPVGFYGAETLPAVYAKKRANRGFEAIAYDPENNIIYAFIQSPIENPDNSVRNTTDVIRILGVDAATGQPVSEYVYLLENNAMSGHSVGRVDKIGDACYIGNGIFAILERDSSVPGENEGKKYVFLIDINKATNILGTPLAEKITSSDPNDKTLEMMTADDLAANEVRPVFKRKLVNLPSLGYLPSDKPEGLTLVGAGDVATAFAVINDNDFGLAGAGVSDDISLGILGFSNEGGGFDASNKDNGINITNWPVLGAYMPDAIANYSFGEKDYYLTANEGDSRDYDGYSEEERIKDLTLDDEYWDGAEIFQLDENLGRLNATTANGDIDGDGKYEYVFTYGARSFSIWDEYGNMTYDSGSEFEVKLSQLFEIDFNSTNDENFSFDNRSDDKGPEPEAVVVGEVEGKTYAFIGLERMGGIMIYELVSPYEAIYAGYMNNRNFDYSFDPDDVSLEDLQHIGDLAPEGLVFVQAEFSPNGKALLITSNEVSGSVTTWALGSTVGVENEEHNMMLINNFPNPFTSSTSINISIIEPGVASLEIYSVDGNKVASISNLFLDRNLHSIEFKAANLPAGAYYCVLKMNGKSETINMVKVK